MGVCASDRNKIPIVEGASDEENFCYRVECEVGLYKVDFEIFQAAIKRFGYRVDLNDEHLRSIAPEINLNIEKMRDDLKSPWAIVYLDPKFTYSQKKFDI